MVASASNTTDVTPAPERRGSARSRLFVMVHTTDDKSPLWAWDIGLGGLQCRSRSPRFPGTYLDLRFTLPGTDETIEVGGQVTSMDAAHGGQVSMGIRFCRLSPRAQMAIYRFLDQRRALWDPEVVEARKPSRLDFDFGEAPFEGLLLEAFAAMRQKELRRPGFVRCGPSRDLETLSRILGRRPTESRRAG